MIIALTILGGLFVFDNKEFLGTVASQVDEHNWRKIDCRPVNPDLPALTFTAPSGEEKVCLKLRSE